MRQKIAAGNWKMNTSIEEGLILASDIVANLNTINNENVKLIIAPPFTHLTSIYKIAGNTKVGLSAQNCAVEQKGAFTGEVSVGMIRDTGTGYVIVGHSERRTMYSESDETLNIKVKLVLEGLLTPIFCCGELLEEREKEIHFKVVETQVEKALFDLSEDDFRKVIIAYEPVWAIGTGKTATPEQAQEMHAFIRKLIENKYGKAISDAISILYGGSCKPSNAKELFSQPDVDGGLIGGASLNAEDFISIANSF